MNSINKIKYYFKRYKDHSITLEEEYDCMRLIEDLENSVFGKVGVRIGLDATEEINRIYTRLFAQHQGSIVEQLKNSHR